MIEAWDGPIQVVDVNYGSFWLPESFLRLMKKLMDKISNVTMPMDNLLVDSQNHEHHLDTLELAMQSLEANHMKIKLFCSQRSVIL
jgi:hypothetical protein